MAVEIPDDEETLNDTFLLQITDSVTCFRGIVSACYLSDRILLDIIAHEQESSLMLVLLIVSIVGATALFAYFAMRQ